MDIVELKEKLSEIKQMEYIETLRKGDTGIGLTLEMLLEVKENNLRTPDLGNVVGVSYLCRSHKNVGQPDRLRLAGERWHI